MTQDGWWWLTCSRHIWEWDQPGGSPKAPLWTPPEDNDGNDDNDVNNVNDDNDDTDE